MAARLTTSHNKGSDQFYDVCCSVCEDDGINKEGLFYCPKCTKIYCDECVFMHNKVLKNHSVKAKGDSDNWPVTKTVEDTLELCEDHTNEKLTMFCENHEKLLCQSRLYHNHSHSTTTRSRTFIIVVIIIIFITIIMNNISLRSSLKNSLENERKQCVTFISKLKAHNTYSIRSPQQSFIIHSKYLDQTASELFLRKVTTTADIEFQHKDLEQFLASCTDLEKITNRVGVESHHHVDQNKVINFQEKYQFNVKTNTDVNTCTISGICEMSNGNLVISDSNNQCVKLLDQAYNVLSQVKLTTSPMSICKIASNEVAVTVSDHNALNEIHVLRVDNGKIIKIKTIKPNHLCYSIAHHKGDMLVTSGTALFQYTTDGRLVKKLYEDRSSKYTVSGVAVSPDGKRIYVTDITNGRLVTLTRDGAVTATPQYHAFKRYNFQEAFSIHVAATGQVFVFGCTSVSQVDTDGMTILATVNLDGCPSSVYFNEDRSKLLVGINYKDSMTEFKTTIS